jgi:hypothetical protein
MRPQQIVDSFFQGKRPTPPLFVLTYGAPASGKTELVNRLLQDLRINPDTVISVLVDDVIEKIPEYREEVASIVQSGSVDDQHLQKLLTDAYFKYRQQIGDVLSDSILYRSMALKYNIVWETTGLDISWALKTLMEARRNGYLLIAMYPFVKEEQLLERAHKRSKTSQNPRRPSDERIKKNVIEAQKNFAKIASVVDRAFVYDNSGSQQDLGVLLELDREYQGYCAEHSKDCKTGVVTRVTCDLKRLQKLKREFEPSYGRFLTSVCRPHRVRSA